MTHGCRDLVTNIIYELVEMLVQGQTSLCQYRMLNIEMLVHQVQTIGVI